jgi:hypothetical protein
MPEFLYGIGLRVVFATFGALLFAAISLVFSAYLLASRLDGDHLENLFPALGRGRVNIARAKLSRFPHPLLLRLVDKESNATVQLPRPFWAENPRLVAEILLQVERGT